MCLDPVCLDPVCLGPVCLDPVCLDPVCLDPVCLDPVCLDSVCLDPVCLDLSNLLSRALLPTTRLEAPPLTPIRICGVLYILYKEEMLMFFGFLLSPLPFLHCQDSPPHSYPHLRAVWYPYIIMFAR